MTSQTSRRIKATIAVALAAITIPVGIAVAHNDDGGLTGAQRKVVREATKRFRDVDVAIAAGYVPTDDCVELPGVGGMGYHYVHPALASDSKIDPTMPEILVYQKTKRGSMQLGALEWFIVDDDQDLATDDDRPTLMGHAFEGPMEGHEPGMPIHYDLHAWVYRHNPAGELAAFNPSVRC